MKQENILIENRNYSGVNDVFLVVVFTLFLLYKALCGCCKCAIYMKLN